MYDKAKIMRRAWELMRTKYRMGNPFTFQQIGRGCLAWCMGEAWRKAKEAARVAAIPADEKARRIERLRAEMDRVDYLPFGMSASKHRSIIQEQIDQLAA